MICMKNKRTYIITLTAALLLLAAAAAQAWDFSAEFVEKEGDQVTKGKIYMAGERSRYEVDGSGEIEVTRADKKVMWIIFPRHRVYVEEEFWGIPSSGLPPQQTKTPKSTGDLTRKDLGYEMVDSYRLRKYFVTVKYNKGQTQDRYYEWYRSGFPVPVKTESENGSSSYEYKKLKMGTQDPGLFAEPRGYRKITMDELEQLEAEWAAKKKK